MPFYIRKALKTGPVRFNLSKSGVGLSGGVTGARVGVGPKGTYVHGGRHGLYYRKYNRKGRKKAGDRAMGKAAPAESAARDISISDSGMVEVFVDTGATYPTPVTLPEERPITIPELPDPNKYGYATAAAAAFLLLPGFIADSALLLLLFGVSLAAMLVLFIREKRGNRAATELLEHFKSKLNPPDSDAIRSVLSGLTEKLPLTSQRKWFAHHGLLSLWLAKVQYPEETDTDFMDQLGQIGGLSADHRKRIRIACFRIFFDDLAKDHQLSEDDEEYLRSVARILDLDREDLTDEFETMRIFGEVRHEIQNKPDPVESPIPLQKNETCYLAVPGRLLNERVQDYRTIDTIKHKYVGYDIEIDGKVILTDKRIIISGKKERSYRLSRIQDVTLSLEDATVQLNLDRRKSPVIITVERPQILAARLQHVIEE